MQTPTSIESIAPVRPWLGIAITGLVALFLAFDGVAKILQVAPVVRATEKLGLPLNSIVPIGIVLLAGTALYANPRTSLLGAILLTAHLGGAVAIHVSARSGAFPICFSIACGLLVWLGLVLREPRLGWLILVRPY